MTTQGVPEVSNNDTCGVKSGVPEVSPRHPNNNINNNINNNSNTSKNKKFSDEDLKSSKMMLSKILEINPNHKRPNIESWANEVRLIRERDGHSNNEIIDLFKWANNDSFWRSNILSPVKLRKQWDKLTIQMNNKSGTTKKQTYDDRIKTLSYDKYIKVVN